MTDALEEADEIININELLNLFISTNIFSLAFNFVYKIPETESIFSLKLLFFLSEFFGCFGVRLFLVPLLIAVEPPERDVNFT